MIRNSTTKEGWQTRPLVKVAEIHDTGRIPIKATKRVAGNTPYCGANGVIDFVEGFTHEGKFALLAEDGGFFKGGENSSYMMNGKFWANNHVHILRGKDGILLSEYLHYFLNHIDLTPFLTGATRPKLTQGAMKKVPVLIPYPDEPKRSLETQRRIVARIEALTAVVREMRQLQAQITADTSQLLDSIIRQIFDKGNEHWTTEIIDKCAFVQSGATKGRRFRDRPTIDLPYLRVANVQAGYLDLEEIKYLTIAADEIERYSLQVGDLLLTEGGDYDKLGRGAIWEGQIDPCIHQNHVFAVRFDQKKVVPKFAEYEMQSYYAKQYFLSVAKRTTNLASINKTQLRAFPFRYPSIEEQDRIVAELDAVSYEIEEMQETQTVDEQLIEQLEQSILAQAFRGEL